MTPLKNRASLLLEAVLLHSCNLPRLSQTSNKRVFPIPHFQVIPQSFLPPLPHGKPKLTPNMRPPTGRVQRFRGIHNTPLKLAQQRGKDLTQLHHRHVLPQTAKPPTPKHHVQRPLHLLQLLVPRRRRLQPPLRPENIRVRAEDLLAPHRRVLVVPDLYAAGEEDAVHRLAPLGRDLGLQARERRPHAQTLPDAGLQVAQVLRRRIFHQGLGAAVDICVELGDEFRVRARRGQDVEQGHADGGCG